MTKNKLLVFAVVLILIVTISLILKVTNNSSEPTAATTKKLSPVVSNPTKELSPSERDTYVNTISTINERNRSLEDRLRALEQSQAINEKKRENEVAKLVDNKIDQRSKSVFDEYQKKFENLLSGLPGNKSEKGYRQRDPVTPNPAEVPQGLGFDSLLNPGSKIGTKPSKGQVTGSELQQAILPSNQMITITPFTSVAYTDDKQNPVPVTITGEPIRKVDDLKAKDKQAADKKAKGETIPFYTIPRNSTLFSNTTLTALLGIVPNAQGSVLDPIRFKLITGPENLASNGHYIPGIRDIVWSGIAVGNREMSCVRGEVHSVTFTFDDGRVYTQSSVKDGNNSTTNVRQILGYISDQRGKPCLTGQLITNAQDYLNDRMIAAGVAATAEGYASTQNTTVISSDGTAQSYFDGNTGDYIAGQTLAASLKELTDYLRERQRNAVDLVYLDGGQDVVLHVEDEITIDYLTNGRKLDYANRIPTQKIQSLRNFD